MPSFEVAEATLEEVGAFHYAISEHAVIRIDGAAVALGSFSAVGERLWAGLILAPSAKAHGYRVVRAMHRFYAERNRTVYAVCGFPAAERLLTVLGFAPTEETVANGKRVWRWLKR